MAASLQNRLILISVLAVMVTASACILLQQTFLRKQSVELTANEMRAVLLSGENVILQSTTGGDAAARANPMSANYFASRLNQMVPVVAAWRAIDGVAKHRGFRFQIASRTPRNGEHRAGKAEEVILGALDGGAEEYQFVDEARNDVVYARPVRLGRDCMGCHADAGSHGAFAAFILRASMDRAAPALQASVNRTALILIPIALLVVGLTAVFVRRLTAGIQGVAGSLGLASENVSAAAMQIATSAAVLNQTSVEQTESIRATSGLVKAIRGASEESMALCADAQKVVDDVQVRVAEGNSELEQLAQSIQEISGASAKVSEIIETIDKIAFQTNLLALNAAVEAARAGAAGLGFGVVADEVRSLAMRCAEASHKTAELIEDSTAKARAGVAVSARVREAFSRISKQSSGATNLMEAVTTATVKQSAQVDEIVNELNRVEEVTQKGISMARESAAVSETMTAQSEGLQKMVGQLQTFVQGR